MEESEAPNNLGELLVQQKTTNRFIFDPWPDEKCPECMETNVIFRISTREMQKVAVNTNHSAIDFTIKKMTDDMVGDFSPEKVDHGFFCGNCQKRIEEEKIKEQYSS